ncbi:hypothetical protein [Pseudobutyrivibrio xylanivorans]|uniref:Uncharacterized protein n=1 Tax=Pseudobutyrivibrio xylanivorans DSM 14809 TaxID=1123012 RepID=A0A1M6DVS5_PSEXY|nr:hypothetical protein [Pseudobutyrivibrio xylanivorans]SHI77128.1 hypothetical protein SAMN02745725_01043 [Pseudobutyrivibrio xylanivorans DSM 14809]
MEEKLLTEEQKSRIHQLEFYYKEATKYVRPATDNELFSLVVKLDENIRRRATAMAVAQGIFGGLLLFTGYNFLTRLSGSFLAGIIIFCIGAVNIALSYPLYNHLVTKARKKYAPVVLTVTKYLG